MFFLAAENLTAQGGFNVSAGIAVPEMLNIGLRKQFSQKQIGFAVGTLPGSDTQLTLTGDFSYHFGGSSELTEVRPWFLKAALTHMTVENEWRKENSVYFGPRVGREFNITPGFGIALEGGILFIISEKETVKKRRDTGFFGDFDLDFTGLVLPSLGLSIYYRI